MAHKGVLRGLGMTYKLADILGDYRGDTASMTAYGANAGSANKIAPNNNTVYVLTGTSSLALPYVGGDLANGCDLGDDFTVTNLTAVSIQIYSSAAAGIGGSSATFAGGVEGASVARATGVSVATFKTRLFVAVSPSTWAAY